MKPSVVRLAFSGGHHCARLDLTVDGAGLPQPPIFWEFSGGLIPRPPDRADVAALAMVFPAMRAGRPLHVDGAVSHALLAGLAEFQDAWASWRPGRYRRVPITAEAVLPDAPRPDDRTAMLMFSGGLDSTNTLLRHVVGAAGARSRRIVAGVLVHGFDVALDQADWFARAKRSCGATLASVGVPLAIVRTNWREAVQPVWEDEFASSIAAVLHAFRGVAGAGMLACDHPWAILKQGLPWGSNPATNPLLGTPDFPVVTDGAGDSCVTAASRVACHPVAAANLRVCCDSPDTGLNCGHCLKCRRRQLQFLVAGFPPGVSFPGPPLRRRDVAFMPVRRTKLIQLREIRDAARGWPGERHWVTAVQVAIALNWLGWGELDALRAWLGVRTRLRRAGWLPLRQQAVRRA